MTRCSWMVVFFGVVSVLCGGQVGAQIEVAGHDPAPPVVAPPRAPGDVVNLVVDDGTRENSVGQSGGGQIVWLNRFSPAEYPIQLSDIYVYFPSTVGLNVGETFDVYLFEDTDGDNDPATNSAFVGEQLGATIAALDDWTTVTLSTPSDFNGPGDVLVAVVNRTAGADSGEYPAAIDETTSQGRSWIGIYSSGVAPSPPTFPADLFWGTVDDAGLPGNFMVRASGLVTPVELLSLSVE